jgi:phosphohistidine phosphatase
MDLILWRHAEAEEGSDDLQRALTARGRRQATQMAEWIRRHLPAPWTVYASPARRTRETVAALHVPFLTLESCSPGAAARDILEAAAWPDHGGSAILVGHQPALGMACALAVTGTAAAWSLRKGAIVWLTSRDREGGSPVQLRASLSPDLI